MQVFAAASLTSVMPQIQPAFQLHFPEARIDFNFAASSILARQIEYGARADIFISANPQWSDWLQKQQLLTHPHKKEFLSNSLVIIVPLQNRAQITSVNQLTKPQVKRIALADWAHVPAGIYAKTALEKYHIWKQIAPKCLPALDVRAALAYVERGDVDCGIVYRTDASISVKIQIVSELPDEIQPEIHYTTGLVTSSRHPLARPFLDFFYSNIAKDIFLENGFKMVNHE
ncbi:MAG: molybdate ABC transporter substrate-binding protein [bacterium]